MNQFFNNRGEINASSLKDLAAQLTKVASVYEENVPSNHSLSQPSVNDDQRDELISRAMMTQDGKIALAQAMASPIK